MLIIQATRLTATLFDEVENLNNVVTPNPPDAPHSPAEEPHPSVEPHPPVIMNLKK
jgi:hypothetical protein